MASGCSTPHQRGGQQDDYGADGSAEDAQRALLSLRLLNDCSTPVRNSGIAIARWKRWRSMGTPSDAAFGESLVPCLARASVNGGTTAIRTAEADE